MAARVTTGFTPVPPLPGGAGGRTPSHPTNKEHVVASGTLTACQLALPPLGITGWVLAR